MDKKEQNINKKKKIKVIRKLKSLTQKPLRQTTKENLLRKRLPKRRRRTRINSTMGMQLSAHFLPICFTITIEDLS
jgi:hypothetical protein